MALDEDSQKFLEEAKKGKPRKFAMLCKGPQIVGLRIYKKGNEEKYKKELKKEATGQFYAGLITGKGQKLVFQLPRDLCEKAPTKEITLKEYLSDEAEMKFKPTYEIVATLGEQEEPADKKGQAGSSKSAAPKRPSATPPNS